MSSLDRLVIRGIRSFDNNAAAVVEFQSPVTVIVGSNGTGKTTIIECLKYATTGELPPNTKGGAFVHDPKMAGEKEVRAQVKLRFHNTNRARMVVTRNLSVSVKKTGLSMKTLEGVLATDEAGESNAKRNTISSKCSEIDAELPRLLGVPHAILDNVIFCHQEESNWPLSEPAKLKAKFDEIFEATKYTAALDAIKKDRKDRVADLKAEKAHLDHLKADKDRAETIKTKISRLTTKITTSQARADDLSSQASELASINLEWREKAEAFVEVFQKRQAIEQRVETWEEEVRGMEESLELLQDSEAELEAQKKDFDRTLAEKRRTKISTDNKRADCEERLRNRETDLASSVRRKGQVEGELTAHERAIDDRVAVVKTICAKLNLTQYDLDVLTADHVVEVTEHLRARRKEAEIELRKLKATGKEEESRLLAKLTELNSTKASAAGSKSNLKTQIDDLERQVRADSHDSQSLQSLASQSDVDAFAAQIAERQALITKAEKALEDGRFEQAKRDRRSDIAKLEAEREALGHELKEIQAGMEQRAKVAVMRGSLDEKRKTIDGIVTANSEAYRTLIGKEIDERMMDRFVAGKVRELEDEVRIKTAERTEIDRKVATQKANLWTERQKVEDKAQELTDFRHQRKELLELHSAGTLQEAVEKLQAEIADRRSFLATADHLPMMFKTIRDNAQRKNLCFGCNRTIEDDESDAFYKYIELMLSDRQRAGDAARWKLEIAAHERQLVEVRAMSNRQPGYEKAKTDSVKLAEDYKKRKAIFEAIEKQAVKVASELEALHADQVKLGALKQEATVLGRIYAEAEALRRDIGNLEASFDGRSTDSPEHLERGIAKVEGNLKDARTALAAAAEEHERLQADAFKHKALLSRTENELLRVEQQLQNLREVQHRLEEAQMKLDGLRQELKDVDARVAAAEVPIRELQSIIEKHREDHGDEIQLAESRLSTLQQQAATLSSATQAVKKWDQDGGPRRLREVEDEVEEQQQLVKSTRSELGELDDRVKALEADFHQVDKRRDTLEANLRHRQYKARIRRAKEEIKALPVEESSEAREKYERNYGKSKQKEQELNSQLNMLQGEISSWRAQLSEDQATLSTEYKDIKHKYEVKLMDVKAAELANIDLERYAKAMDMGVMSYHKVKMDEINDSIKTLWNTTYQGTDIDTIAIRSDSEEPKTTTMTARRSYNYRVVMEKDQVEMDMRGRCSAGQKVLASIIIRLALSDSFGHNCGIIALDEPTTNLDKENIASLAQSLVTIIDERKQSGNFQLIVITHDETFLRELAFAGQLDVYMRVSRDNQQKSVINRHKTATLNH